MTTSASIKTDSTDMDVEDSDFKPLSAEQAQQLREANPELSPWWVIVAQVVAGLVVAGIAWVWTGRPIAGASALYGALAVAVPAALFVRGAMRVAKRGTQEAGLASAAMLRFFVWELIKLGLTIAFLAARAKPWLSTVHDTSTSAPSCAAAGALRASTIRSGESLKVTGTAIEWPTLLSV